MRGWHSGCKNYRWTKLVGFEVNSFEIPPALLPPNLHLARINLHEHTPCCVTFSQKVWPEIRCIWRDNLSLSFQFPPGSQQGYGGIMLQVEQVIGGFWHQEV